MASTAALAPIPSVGVPADAALPRSHAAHIRAVGWEAFEAPANRLEWDALAACAAEPNPFYESWYLLPSLRALDPERRVKLLRFDCDGVLAGLLPIAREAKYYRWPIPHWRFYSFPTSAASGSSFSSARASRHEG